MNNRDQIKEKILINIQKEAVSQEFRVRKIFEKISFDENEITSLISQFISDKSSYINYKELIENDFKELKCSFISRHFYESVDTEGVPKQRELDIISYYDIIDNESMLFFITFLGDVKNTDDFKWVFADDVTSDEVENSNFDFPKISFNSPSTFPHFIVNDIFVLYKEYNIPITNHLISFQPSGEKIKKNKSEKTRNFCEQITDGLERYYYSRVNYIPETYKSRIVHHIIIPIIITSSNYLYCKKLPPENIKELEEVDAVLYLFNPSRPSILNRLRIPILIVSENSLEKTIKDLLIAFKKRSWSFLSQP